MSFQSDGNPYVPAYQDEFQPQFETTLSGSVGIEVCGYDFLSASSGYDQSFGMGTHGSEAHHVQYQSFEPHYYWEDPFGHGQEGVFNDWGNTALPADQWNYVDVEDVGMYGSDTKESSLVSDAVESQSTESVYGSPKLQLQEGILTSSTTPSQQHVDNTYGLATSKKVLSRQPEDPKASTQAGMPQYTCFKAAKEDVSPKHWRCPVDDPTLPKTDSDRQHYVRQLLAALNNVEDTLGEQGHSFKKRWYDSSKGYSNYYTPRVKEALCWLILSQAESLHTHGPSETFTSFDPNFWTAAKRTCHWSFSERVNMIAKLLATSKSKCDALLGGGSLQLVVANPDQRLRATKADVRQNTNRKELLQAVKGRGTLNKRVKVEAEK